MKDKEQAIKGYEQELATARESGDRHIEAYQLGNLGITYYDLGQMEQASKYFEQALTIAREIDDRKYEESWLKKLGIVYRNLGSANSDGVVHGPTAPWQRKQAIEYYKKSLIISQKLGDRRSEANRWSNLGRTYISLRQLDEAIDCYEKSLNITRELANRRSEGNRLYELGYAYYLANQKDLARECWQQAFVIFEEIGSPNAAKARQALGFH